MNSSERAVVTIGSFDGVHRGHQHLLRQVADRARSLGVLAAAVTFDPHPREVLRPGFSQLRLTSVAEKVGLLRLHGMNDVWVCHFTREIAQLEPSEFLQLVSAHWPIAELWVGSDFALGRGRSGSIDVLRQLGAEGGWALQAVPPFTLDGEVVSSSRIRALLEQGNEKEAARLIGRSARPILAR